ncbi:hypothetical protein AMTR_s00068p00182880 [Amborella trichopoda]|uniref:Metallothionein-like protein n=1 Tax=Amborella trichopoda TaxID=13333 RepID=U5DGA6_AMBTC|nr:hypothetical protein AMTR_s00068p00182880 [Amborella trichopoda]
MVIARYGCRKKVNSFGLELVETEKSYFDEVVEMAVAEHDPKCKCGPVCPCVNCTCGH